MVPASQLDLGKLVLNTERTACESERVIGSCAVACHQPPRLGPPAGQVCFGRNFCISPVVRHPLPMKTE
jgi:hypothetical protein